VTAEKVGVEVGCGWLFGNLGCFVESFDGWVISTTQLDFFVGVVVDHSPILASSSGNDLLAIRERDIEDTATNGKTMPFKDLSHEMPVITGANHETTGVVIQIRVVYCSLSRKRNTLENPYTLPSIFGLFDQATKPAGFGRTDCYRVIVGTNFEIRIRNVLAHFSSNVLSQLPLI